MIFIDSKISEILDYNFNSGRILALHNIPFAYYLKFTLKRVAEIRKVDPLPILDELNSLSKQESNVLLDLDIKQLIDKIINEFHDYSRKRLSLAEKNYSIMYQEFKNVFPSIETLYDEFLEFIDEYESHLLKEEQAIFPEIINMKSILDNSIQEIPKSLEVPLENMEREHIEQERFLEKVYQDSISLFKKNQNHSNFISFKNEMDLFFVNHSYHVYFENEILFKKTRRLENTFFFKT
jgi:iron-sulfur cluster repair protein YtfE (RIC family)